MNGKANSLKCTKCGLVNFASVEVCKRCGVALTKRGNQESGLDPASAPSAQVDPVISDSYEFGKWQLPNLAPCPDCNHQVSSQAMVCPNCGRLLAAPQSQPKSTSKERKIFGVSPKLIGILAAFAILVLVTGLAGLIFSGPNTQQPQRKFSSKAEQIQATMDSYSEAECERNDKAISSPYHTMTDLEKAARYFCSLKVLKARNPDMWEEAMKPYRTQPPDATR
jgi:Double zinc ribbon